MTPVADRRSPHVPLSDLLVELRARGMRIGVDQHLLLTKLLAGWPDPDLRSLRDAVAAVLSRNAADLEVVAAVFDDLYARDAPSRAATTAVVPPPVRRPRRWWLVGIACAALVAGAVGWAAWLRLTPHPEPSERPPVEAVDPHVARPVVEAPELPSTTRRVVSWPLVDGIASLVFAGSLACFHYLLGSAERRRRARAAWQRQVAELPGPSDYEVDARLLHPPFARAALDDLAAIFARGAVATRRSEIDVDRTVIRTVDAGLAPTIVPMRRRGGCILVVLEEESAAMRPWRRRTEALLEGLATRGVAVERWTFREVPTLLVRRGDGAVLSLERVLRMRADHWIVVVGMGDALADPSDEASRRAAEQLRKWTGAAWLHPVPHDLLWRAKRERLPLPAWPMTRRGLIDAAAHVVRGARPSGERSGSDAEGRLTPMDVERLAWLVALSPRRDSDIAEILRQRFCPDVSPAAVGDALLVRREVATPSGLDAAEVRRFLRGVFREPAIGESLAHDRWALDRATLGLQAGDRDDAVNELRRLAQGPLAGHVDDVVHGGLERAVDASPVPRDVVRDLERRVRRAGAAIAVAESRPGERRLWLPRGAHVVAALVAGLAAIIVAWGSPTITDEIPLDQWGYDLSVGDTATKTGDFTLLVAPRPRAPAAGLTMMRDGEPVTGKIVVFGTWAMSDEDRGHWYHAQSGEGATLLVSQRVFVGRGVATIVVEVRQDGAVVPEVAYEATSLPTEGQAERKEGVSGRELEVTPGTWRLRAREASKDVDVALGGPQSFVLELPTAQIIPVTDVPVVDEPVPGTLVVEHVDENGRGVAGIAFEARRLRARPADVVPGSSPTKVELARGSWLVDTADDRFPDVRVTIRSGEESRVVVRAAASQPEPAPPPAPEPVSATGTLLVKLIDASGGSWDKVDYQATRYSRSLTPPRVAGIAGVEITLEAGTWGIVPGDSRFPEGRADVKVGERSVLEIHERTRPPDPEPDVPADNAADVKQAAPHATEAVDASVQEPAPEPSSGSGVVDRITLQVKPGRPTLDAREREPLRDVASAMQKDESLTATVVAHVVPSRSTDYDAKFSARLAESVRQDLVSMGVDASRISAEGRVEASLDAPNQRIQGSVANASAASSIGATTYNRVEVTILRAASGRPSRGPARN